MEKIKMFDDSLKNLKKKPEPIIERIEERIRIHEEHYEWLFPWTYILYFSVILPPFIAWKLSENIYSLIVYGSFATIISSVLIYLGYKSRTRIPAKFKTEVTLVHKYRYFCRICFQDLGKHQSTPKGMQCSRCGSNRITIYDPLEDLENSAAKNLPVLVKAQESNT